MTRGHVIGIGLGAAGLVGLYLLWGRDYLRARKAATASVRQQTKSIGASYPVTPQHVTSSKRVNVTGEGSNAVDRVQAQIARGALDPVGFQGDKWGVAG